MWRAIAAGSAAAAAGGDGAAQSKWDERPLPVVARKPGQAPDKRGILAAFMGKIAKWWMLDDLVFVDAIPHSAAGKVQSLVRCQRFAGDRLTV